MSRKLEIELEKRIAAQAVADLLAAGYSISVNDGENTELVRSTDPAAIAGAMFSTDEDWLYVHGQDGKAIAAWDETGTRDCLGWVRFIWGNVADVLSDYSVSLEQHLKGANEIAAAYMD
jgi:hypothetical protein